MDSPDSPSEAALALLQLRQRRLAVVVESPFMAPTPEGLERNLAYARAALRDCLLRGEAPFASHLLYTQPGVLDDADPDERALGIEAGLALVDEVDKTVVYADLGVSRGMEMGIERARSRGRPVEFRSLPGWAPSSPQKPQP